MMRAAILASFVLLGAWASVADAAASPRLVLRSGTYVSVQAIGFGPSEEVVVVANGRKLWRRTVVASPRGTFVVRLPLVFRLAKCDGFVVSATGTRGHRAIAGMGSAGCAPAPSVTVPTP
jgi:hypothetical protein